MVGAERKQTRRKGSEVTPNNSTRSAGFVSVIHDYGAHRRPRLSPRSLYSTNLLCRLWGRLGRCLEYLLWPLVQPSFHSPSVVRSLLCGHPQQRLAPTCISLAFTHTHCRSHLAKSLWALFSLQKRNQTRLRLPLPLVPSLAWRQTPMRTLMMYPGNFFCSSH